MVIAAYFAIAAVLAAGCFISGFFLAMKAVQLGLKWKIQSENNAPPTTPAQDAKTAGENAAVALDNAKILDEWLNGKPAKDDDA
jgi:hypothetical protein